MTLDAIIIGGGHNGLVCASFLAFLRGGIHRPYVQSAPS